MRDDTAPKEKTRWEEFAVKFMMNDLAGIFRKHGYDLKDPPVPPGLCGITIRNVFEGKMTRSQGRQAIEEMIEFVEYLQCKVQEKPSA